MRPVDLRLLRLGRATRVYLGTEVLLGAARAALLIAQAWLLAKIIAGVVSSGDDLADLRVPVVILLGVVAGRALVTWSSELAANQCSARVKSTLRAALVERAVQPGPDGGLMREIGRHRHPGRAGDRRPRRVLFPLSASAVPGRDRAGGRPGGGTQHRLGIGRHHGGHAAADPGLHGADRDGHQGPQRPPVVDAAEALRSLPRRGQRTRNLEDLRSFQAAGGGDRRAHRRLSPPRDDDATSDVPFLAGAGVVGECIGGPHRRCHRAAPVGGPHRPALVVVCPGAGAGGLSTAAAAGRRLSCQRRRTQRGRAGLLGS